MATDTPGAPRRSVAVRLKDVTIRDKTTSRTILQDISLDIPRGSVVVCTGPVGSGKTMLTRAILGEVRLAKGEVCISSRRIGYCTQTPWLPNQSLKDIVCGPTAKKSRDEAWYEKVIMACCLDEDLKLLPAGDLTMAGSKGMNLSGGQRQRVALARAIYSRCEIFLLDDSFSSLDGKTETQTIENLLGREGILSKLGAAVFWVTNATRHFHLADEVIVLADHAIKERGTWEELRSDANHIDRIIHSVRESTRGVDVEEKSRSAADRRPAVSDGAKDLSRKNGDLSLYGYYFRAASVENVLFMVSCAAIYSCFNTIPQYWLKKWTDSDHPDTIFFMAGYLVLLIIAWISTNGIMWSTVLRVAPTSGMTLHHRLLFSILGAPLAYFSGTDSGTILNRFGQDIQLVDKQLASAVSNLSVQVFKLLMQASLLLVAQPLTALSLPFSALIVYAVQKFYLRTSRQLRFLELESRAAVFSSFLETVQGISTVRALGWERELARGNLAALDRSQQPLYLVLCVQRWLNVVLDLLVATLAVGTIWLAVELRARTTGGQVGVALNVVLLANTTLLRLVQSWTDLEISLGAVARLRETEEDTPREEEEEEQEEGPQPRGSGELALPPPDGWPPSGAVEIRALTAAYSRASVALRRIDLRVAAGQTVVVCGRTGSGKSSLLLSLLRLLDVRRGAVVVDGVDLGTVRRSAVRQRAFVTVAQDAFFLPGASLRFNLDPTLGASALCVAEALRRTGLWSHFAGGGHQSSRDGGVPPDVVAGILEKPLSSLPSLSVGQAQLLALARALVRKKVVSGNLDGSSGYSDGHGAKPVILLDEVTSSLDAETESAVYDVVQRVFIEGGHTVVMVTHKLGNFVHRMRPGRDIVVWLKDGSIQSIEAAGNIRCEKT